jgi:hypothetical protein
MTFTSSCFWLQAPQDLWDLSVSWFSHHSVGHSNCWWSRQHIHSWFWVLQDSWPYFSVSQLFKSLPLFGLVGSGELLLALASTVILGSKSWWTNDHILLSHGCFGSHWSYVTWGWTKYRTPPPKVPTCVFTEPLPRDGHLHSGALPPLFWLFGIMSQYCFHSILIIQTKWMLPRKHFCSHVL